MQYFLCQSKVSWLTLTPTLHKLNWIYQAWNYFIVTFSGITPKTLATIITHFSRRGSKVSFMFLRIPAFLSGWDSNTLSNELNSADCEKREIFFFEKQVDFSRYKSSFQMTFRKPITRLRLQVIGDWFKNLTLVFQPMRSKTNRNLYARFFPCSEQVKANC